VLGIICPPPPLRINRPQRNVRKNNNRSARRKRLEIFFQPVQLFGAQNTKAAFANVQHVDQANKVHAFLVKAVPTRAESVLSKALSIKRTVVADHVVFARDVKYPACLDTLEILFERVEFFRLGKVAQVAGVQDEIRRIWQRIDLRNRFLQCPDDVLVRLLVKADVAVADLDETEVATCDRSRRTEYFGRK